MNRWGSVFVGVFLLLSLAVNVWFVAGRCREYCGEAAVQAGKKVEGQVQTGEAGQAGEHALARVEKKERLIVESLSYSDYSECVQLNLNLPVSYKELNAHLEVTPAVEFKLGNYLSGSPSSYWWVKGDFKSGSTYTVRIRQGLADVKGNSLKRDAVFSLTVPDMKPRIEFLSDGPYYPQQGRDFTLPVQLVNLTEFEVTVQEYYENNIRAFADNNYRMRAASREIVKKTVKIPGVIPKNEKFDYALDLRDLLGEWRTGLFYVTISNYKDNYWATSAREVIISDLGLQSVWENEHRRAGFVVQNLSTGAPVANAEITAFSFKNQEILHGKTNRNGTLICDFLPSYEDRDDYPVVIVAKSGKDTTFLHYSRVHDLTSFGNAGRQFVTGPQAFVYPGRGVCRPGEKILVSAFLRQCASRENKALSDSPCLLEIVDPSGKKLVIQKKQTNQAGFFSEDILIPASARTGRYEIVCRIGEDEIGRADFLVSAYMPDRIKVALNPLVTEGIAADSEVEFKVDANYYFGQPVTDGEVSFDVKAVQAPNQAFWGDYTVGNPRVFKQWSPFRLRRNSLGDGVFKFPGFNTIGEGQGPVVLQATASVSEPGGRPVSATTSVICQTSKQYLGLRYEGEESRAVIGLKLFGWTKDAEIPPADRQLKAELCRLEWNYVLQNQGNRLVRQWVQESIPAEECPSELTLTSTEDKLVLADLPDGHYQLLVSGDEVGQTVLEFWHYAGEAGARSANPAALSLKTDREKYEPGDTAVITLDSPGKGQLALAMGDDRLEKLETCEVVQGSNEIKVRIPRDLQASVFNVGVTLVVPGSDIFRSFALARLKVSQDRNRLRVAVTAPELARPGEKIDLTLQLSDVSGKAKSGSVHVFGVDEGILALTSYKTPDIFSYFFGERYCNFCFLDLYSQIFPDIRLGKDGRFGGDGVNGEAVRKAIDFKMAEPALFDLGMLEVPGNGKLQTTVSLPKHTGAIRIMAVAASDKLLGQGEAALTMREAISVLASAPRAVASGDEFDITLNLFNHDLAEGEYKLSVNIPEGSGLTAVNGGEMSGTLAKGGSVAQRLKFQAVANGRAEIGYCLTLGGQESRGTVPVVIRPLNPPLSLGENLTIAAGESLEIAGEMEAWEAGTLQTSVTVAAGLGKAILPEALGWLNRYPYGCLEQTTSCAFPFLAVNSLEKLGLISPEVAETAAERCEMAASRILSMRLSSGGFSMWPGGTTVWDSGSLFAIHYLFWGNARNMLSLDNSVLNPSCRYLEEQARKSQNSRGYRGYAIYVLSFQRQAEAVTLARNLLNEREPDDLGSFFASLALIQGGQAAAGAEYLQQVLEYEVWRNDGEPFEFSNESCRMGMCLAMLTDVMPEHEATRLLAYELAKKLRKDGQGWGTTQSNAWCVLGLSTYALATGEEAGELEAVLDGNIIRPASELQKTVTFEVKNGNRLVLRNTGKGTLFCHVSRTGIPKEISTSRRAWTVKREYLDEDGKPVTSARHGDLLKVRLTLDTMKAEDNILICDLLPGGLEIEDERLATRATSLPALKDERLGSLHPSYIEKLDDRFLLFGHTYGGGQCVFTYTVRAISNGHFRLPPCLAESMYDPESNGIWSDGGEFVIE